MVEISIIDRSDSSEKSPTKTPVKTMSQDGENDARRKDSSSIDWDRVQKCEKIGTGGYSTVYRGRYRHKEIAIKLIEKRNRKRDQIIEDLRREALIMASVRNVNVVRFFGVTLVEPYSMAIELCRGGSLQRLLKQLPNIPLKTLISWAIQIGSGLAIMHNRSPALIHRDIKADNVLVKQLPCECEHLKIGKLQKDDGTIEKICVTCRKTPLNELILKISDFGLACEEGESSKRMEGSLPWMSPDYIRKLIPSTKTDIWSYGVLLWEIITKEIPYLGKDEQALLFAIAQNWVQLDIPEDCPEILKLILEKCWEKEPKKRPEIDEIIEMLKREKANTRENYVYVVNPENLQKMNQNYVKALQYAKNYVHVNKIDVEDAIKTGKQYIYLPLDTSDQPKTQNSSPTGHNLHIPTPGSPSLSSQTSSQPARTPPKSPNFVRKLGNLFGKFPKLNMGMGNSTPPKETPQTLTVPQIMTPSRSVTDISQLFPPVQEVQRARSSNELHDSGSTEFACVDQGSYLVVGELGRDAMKSCENLALKMVGDSGRKSSERSCGSPKICVFNESYVSAAPSGPAAPLEATKSCTNLAMMSTSAQKIGGASRPRFSEAQEKICVQNLAYVSAQNQTYLQVKDVNKPQALVKPHILGSSSRSCSDLTQNMVKNSTPTSEKSEKPKPQLMIANLSYVSAGHQTYAQLKPEEKSTTNMRPRAHTSTPTANSRIAQNFADSMESRKTSLEPNTHKQSFDGSTNLRLRAQTEISTGTPGLSDVDKSFTFAQSLPVGKMPPPLPQRSPRLEARVRGVL